MTLPELWARQAREEAELVAFALLDCNYCLRSAARVLGITHWKLLRLLRKPHHSGTLAIYQREIIDRGK